MKRILMIEDNELVADVYEEKLRSEGFAVDLARDGESGLELYGRHKPDLVLLDLMLPQLGGVEVLSTIRSQYGARELPVVVLSNACAGGLRERAWDAGANEVLSKAANAPSQVVRLVKSAFEQAQSGEVSLNATQEVLLELWRLLKTLAIRHDDSASLRDMHRRIEALAVQTDGTLLIVHLAATLEALLRKLSARPSRVSPGVLCTLAEAFDTLEFLVQNPLGRLARNPAEARILLVDDDSFALSGVTAALVRARLRTTCINCPTSALNVLAAIPFDLVILDIELPEMTGFELCRKLRAMPQYRRTPVIFLSVRSSLEDHTEIGACGGNAYMTKPFLPEELVVKAMLLLLRDPFREIRPPGDGGDVSPLKEFILNTHVGALTSRCQTSRGTS